MDIGRISVENFLKNQELPTHLKGFKFLASAIILISQNIEKDINITDLYKEIGKKHNATYSKVERDIRYLFSYSKFNINGKRLTNKYAITYLTTSYLENILRIEKAV